MYDQERKHACNRVHVDVGSIRCMKHDSRDSKQIRMYPRPRAQNPGSWHNIGPHPLSYNFGPQCVTIIRHNSEGAAGLWTIDHHHAHQSSDAFCNVKAFHN